jgi:hypothetical protein
MGRAFGVLGIAVIPWRAIADLMWDGKTIQQACEELDLEYKDVMFVITLDMKRFLLDTSMLARYRDEELLCHAQ